MSADRRARGCGIVEAKRIRRVAAAIASVALAVGCRDRGPVSARAADARPSTVIDGPPPVVLETIAPTPYGEQVDDPGVGTPDRNRVRWRYRADAHRFEVVRATRVATVGGHDVGAPLPPPSPLP